MKLFTNKNIKQKIIITIILCLMCNFVTPCVSRANAITDYAVDIVQGLFLLVGDAGMYLAHLFFAPDQVGDLIDDSGDKDIPNFTVTPEEIFQNKIDALDVNFFNPNSQDSIAAQLQKYVAGGYTALRYIAVVALLSVLVYLGIQIMLGSTGQKKAEYKEKLKGWFLAMCLLFAMHYLMVFSMFVIEQLTKTFALDASSAGITVEGDTTEYNAMEYTRIMAQEGSEMEQFGYIVIYLVMVAFTFIFLGKYLKRVVYMAFLTIIAPLVAATYPIEKSKSFNRWFKEYISQLLIQPINMLIYFVLIVKATELVKVNILYVIISLFFINNAEKLVVKIFNISGPDEGKGAFAKGLVSGAVADRLLSGGGSKGKGSSTSGQSQKQPKMYENRPSTAGSGAPSMYDGFGGSGSGTSGVGGSGSGTNGVGGSGSGTSGVGGSGTGTSGVTNGIDGLGNEQAATGMAAVGAGAAFGAGAASNDGTEIPTVEKPDEGIPDGFQSREDWDAYRAENGIDNASNEANDGSNSEPGINLGSAPIVGEESNTNNEASGGINMNEQQNSADVSGPVGVQTPDDGKKLTKAISKLGDGTKRLTRNIAGGTANAVKDAVPAVKVAGRAAIKTAAKVGLGAAGAIAVGAATAIATGDAGLAIKGMKKGARMGVNVTNVPSAAYKKIQQIDRSSSDAIMKERYKNDPQAYKAKRKEMEAKRSDEAFMKDKEVQEKYKEEFGVKEYQGKMKEAKDYRQYGITDNDLITKAMKVEGFSKEEQINLARMSTKIQNKKDLVDIEKNLKDRNVEEAKVKQISDTLKKWKGYV